jgi:predicted amidohydrolase/GNAT superfamily N-acetyltransferase
MTTARKATGQAKKSATAMNGGSPALTPPTTPTPPAKEETPASRRPRVRARIWTKEDIPGIIACHRAAYPEYPEGAYYTERFYEMQLAAFPEGQFLAEVDGKIVGYATSIIVQLDDRTHTYTYEELTGAGTFSTNDPSGDTLYGADIAVHPGYRGMGVAGKLYEQRKRLLRRYNLRRMVAYGRIPGYNAVAGKMTAEEYVEKVVRGEMKDSSLQAHLKAGYEVKRVMLDFLWDDSSLNYSTWLEMPNPDYQPEKRQIAAAPLQRPVRKIRVCAAQYFMRPIRYWDEFEQTVMFFVDTADTYHCHFLVFPELFTVQLFSLMPSDLDTRSAIKQLAGMTSRYIDLFTKAAVDHGLYIIAGSHPVIRDDEVYNVAHLFTPNGDVYTQDALHVPPIEREDFGFEPGEEIKVFDTPLARIAILVSYDIEFPELSRLVTLSGAEVLFVPYSTDEKNAYDRVRYTAQARSVENSVYTVIAGNVGNLPTVKNYLINYGRAAVFTPSDFAFPPSGTAGEAEPNVETVVITDLDLTSLSQQRELSRARHLYDRRADLYDVRAKKSIKIVRTE